MNQFMADIRKLLPSLALGVCITLLAALLNHVIHGHRLSAMADGNRLFPAEGKSAADAGGRSAPSTARILAALMNIGDDIAIDAMHAVRGAGEFPSTRDKIAVVAIDEASIMRLGAWPWSRRDIARLVQKTGGARVLGLDLLFGESDRTSLSNYVGRFEALFGTPLDTARIEPDALDNDLVLAREIARHRSVVGTVLHDGRDLPGKPDSPIAAGTLEIRTAGGGSVPADSALLKRASRVLAGIKVIRGATPRPDGEGFMNLFHAPGDPMRAIPLLARVPEDAFAVRSAGTPRICPSMPLEIMRVFLGGDGYRVVLENDTVAIPRFSGADPDGRFHPVKGVSIVKSVPGGSEEILGIPLNEFGEMAVGFGNHRGDYTVYPAWEVLAGKHDGEFAGKLVVMGAVISGAGFGVSGSGFAASGVSVVEAHAAMLSLMLKRDFMDNGRQGGYFWQQAAIILSGLAVTAAIVFGNLGVGIVVSVLALLGTVAGNYLLFFRRGLYVGPTPPLVSALAVLAVQAIADYLVVGRERRFIRKAFALNVSPSILGYMETHPDRLSSLQGENRNMTVLFSDIRGFTAISERMTAPDLARFLNEYFTPMSDIVMKNTGTVDKFIGDGLMAFWNAPADNPFHARDAARAGLGMLAVLQELQGGWTARGLPRVSIGCGINTGPMFAGYMGSEQRKNYTVMGDSVNIASRLENLNKAYASSILITGATRLELGGGFVCRVADKVRVSGKMEAVVIYELLREGDASDEELEELAAFTRVFELYQAREFAAAETLLKELVFIRPTPIYEMYLKRLAIYKAMPPPPDWDGTFSMTKKGGTRVGT